MGINGLREGLRVRRNVLGGRAELSDSSSCGGLSCTAINSWLVPKLARRFTALAERLELSGLVCEDETDELLVTHLGEGWLPTGEQVGG